MDIETITRHLAASDFFRGVAPPTLERLAHIAIPKSLAKNQTLFVEGREGRAMALLVRGAVRLTKSGPEGREIVIKIVRAGEIFAEVILFEQPAYPVSAAAVEPSLVLLLPRLEIGCLLESASFRNDFIAMLMKKQRYLADRILSLSAHDLERRFFGFLRAQQGEREEYRLSLAKKEIAAALGAAPESFSRLLGRLKEEGTVTWEQDRIRLRPGFWRERDPD
jgi:CRP-like cAMP-binding protein